MVGLDGADAGEDPRVDAVAGAGLRRRAAGTAAGSPRARSPTARSRSGPAAARRSRRTRRSAARAAPRAGRAPRGARRAAGGECRTAAAAIASGAATLSAPDARRPASPRGARELERDRVAAPAVADQGDELGVAMADACRSAAAPAAVRGGARGRGRAGAARPAGGAVRRWRADPSRAAAPVGVGEIAGEEPAAARLLAATSARDGRPRARALLARLAGGALAAGVDAGSERAGSWSRRVRRCARGDGPGRSSWVSTAAAAAISATAIANSRGRSLSRSGRFHSSRSRSTTRSSPTGAVSRWRSRSSRARRITSSCDARGVASARARAHPWHLRLDSRRGRARLLGTVRSAGVQRISVRQPPARRPRQGPGRVAARPYLSSRGGTRSMCARPRRGAGRAWTGG